MALNVAVLGAGRIGTVHAQAIHRDADAKLVAVADAMPAAAQKLADDFNCVVSTINAIEADNSIDAVIICTPTDTHADLIENFARAGKGIFCEKPIDLSAKRVRECLRVVADCNAKLMVGFNRRFDDSFLAVKSAIDQGTIGDVELVEITSRDPAPPPIDYIKRSGGLFRDMTIHDFDMARFLLGEEVDSVSAHASNLVDAEIGDAGDVDTATVILETATGKQAVISNSRRASYGYDQRIEVHGSKGMAAADNPHPQTVHVANETGYTTTPLHHFFMTRYEQAYANEIAAFVQIMNQNAEVTPSGEDGLASLLIADAAYLSLQEKRRVQMAELS